MSEIGPKSETKEEKTIADLQNEARDAKDPKEKVVLYMNAAKKHLATWGIDDLTNIEAVHLRNIVEDLLPKFEEQRKLLPEGKLDFGDYGGALHFDMCEEAAVQWLFKLYGINRKDIPEIFIVEDLTTGERYSFEKTMRKEGFVKETELRNQNHEVDHYEVVSDDFREYIKKIRGKAHHEE
jgi:hypothetical protein